MKSVLRKAEDMTFPALKNLSVGQPLRPFLLVDGLSKVEQQVSEKWIVKLIDQFSEMKAKSQRVRFKSLAGILTLQEKIGDECTRRWSSLPAVKAAVK